MWIRTFSETYSGVSADAIWKLWTDIENWPKWHGDLEYCRLEGEFKVGSHFYLKPKNMRTVKIELTDIVEGVQFTDCTRFPGAKMYDTHKLEKTADGVTLSNKLTVQGPLKWIWIQLVAKYVADSVPEETEALVALARSGHE